MAVVFDVHELSVDRQIVTSLDYPANQNCLHPELVSCGLRIDFSPPIPQNRIARHYGEMGQLRKVVDETLGYAVAQILRVRVGSRIVEGQDCDGVDCGSCFPRSEINSCHQQGYQSEHANAEPCTRSQPFPGGN